MRASGKTSSLLGAFWLLGVMAFGGCSGGDTRTINNAPGAVISEEAFYGVIVGGLCPTAAGENPYDVCKDANRTNPDGMDQYLPQSLILQHQLDPSPSRVGYDYRLRWNYSPSSQIDSADLHVSWQMYEDPAAELTQANISFELLRQHLRTVRSYTPNEAREFTARELRPGRRYVYYLGGNFLGGRAQDSGSGLLLIYGAVIFQRIVIDLTLAQLPR